MSTQAQLEVESHRLPLCKLEAGEALDRLESSLGNLAWSARHEAIGRVATAAIEVAQAVAQLPRGQVPPAIVERALALGAAVRTSRAYDAWPTDVGQEISAGARGVAGAIARMLAGPAWRSASTPVLGKVPEALWGEYAAWLFAAPQRFSAAGDENRFHDHGGRHLVELTRWVECNLGSAAVRAALQGYLEAVQALPFTVAEGSLKRHAELHGRILAAASGAKRNSAPQTRTRDGRRLRVAFVGSQPAAIPAWYGSLDSDRFEVSAHVLGGVDDSAQGSEIGISAILSLLRADNRDQPYRQLPPTLAEQMAELRELEADVVVYAEELALAGAALTRLATQRIAPLQLAVAPVGVTTGLAAIDLLVVGGDAAVGALAEQCTERVALVPGLGRFLPQAAEARAERAEARSALALPETSCVLVTVARLAEVTPGRMDFWTELLRRIPEAVLVLQLLDATEFPAQTIELLGAEFDARLQSAGVEVNRGLISAQAIGTMADLQRVVAAADLFVDTGVFGEPDLLLAALAGGVPAVALTGATLRAALAPALLRNLGLSEQIAPNHADLAALIAGLAADPAKRSGIAARQQAALEGLPLCRDELALAAAYGAVLARAYDELHEVGPRKFRRGRPFSLAGIGAVEWEAALQLGREALAVGDQETARRQAREVLQSAPAHAEARWLLGRSYLAREQFAPAVDYLLAAVQSLDDGALWYDLAVALRGNQQAKEALQALETSLRHDGTRADAWVMLFELARAVGADETAQEAMTALRTCAPHDPRLPALEAEMPPAVVATC